MKLVQRIFLQYYTTRFKIISGFSPRLAAKMAFNLFCTPYTKTRDKQPDKIFEIATKLSLKVGHDTVNGFKWTTPGKQTDKTILICHGFDSNSYRFAEYIKPLLDEGFNVIAFDAPGHGTSTGKTITVLLYSAMIKLINEKHGPLYGIMAHSFGGLAAVLALEENEELACEKLVLIAPSTETTHAIETFFNYIRLAPKVRKEFLILIEQLSGNPVHWFSVSRAIHGITPQTLWIHDKQDFITPYRHMEQLRVDKPKHVTFEITEGLGHSPYRQPEILQKIISFFSDKNQTLSN